MLKIKFHYSKSIEKSVKKQILAELIKNIKSNFDKIKSDIKSFFKEQIKQTDEYDSLIRGKLLAEFGLVKDKAQQTVDTIIDVFAGEIDLFIVNDSIYVYVARSDFAQIIGLPEAAHQIPWLQWFLTSGSNILVFDGQIVYGNYENFPNSRSKKALMIEFKDRLNVWSVPRDYQYAGTIEDNWLTYTLDSVVDIFKQKLIEIMIKYV